MNQLEQTSTGMLRALVYQMPNEAEIEDWHRLNIGCIALWGSTAWNKDQMSFLERLPNVRRLSILEGLLTDDALQVCPLLEELDLYNVKARKWQGAALDNLHSASITWASGFAPIFQWTSLQRLILEKVPRKHLHGLVHLKELRDLVLFGPKAEEGEAAIAELARLESLRLIFAGAIDLECMLVNKSSLRTLWIQNADLRNSLNAISKCSSLEELILEHVGTVGSLEVFGTLSRLRKLVIMDRTKILEVNPSHLEPLRCLRYIELPGMRSSWDSQSSDLAPDLSDPVFGKWRAR